MTVKTDKGRGAVPDDRRHDVGNRSVPAAPAERRVPKLFSPPSEDEGQTPDGATRPTYAATKPPPPPKPAAPAQTPRDSAPALGAGQAAAGTSSSRTPRSTADGDTGAPPANALFTAPQREAARVQREQGDEQLFESKMQAFKALPRPEQMSHLRNLRQSIEAEPGGPAFMRRVERVQAGLTGRMLDVPPLPEDIEESAKVAYDGLKLRDMTLNGGARRDIREEAWEKAVDHQRKSFSSPGSQSILSTLRWAETYEREKAIPELKAQTDPRAFDAMKKAYEQFNGKKVPEAGPEWSQETIRENYDIYRAAKHAQDKDPDFALVSPEGVQRAIWGYGANPPPQDSDVFAHQAISASLEIEKGYFGQLRSKSDEFFFGMSRLALEAIEGAPLNPTMSLGNAHQYISAAATAQRAFETSTAAPLLKEVTAGRIVLGKQALGDKLDNPDQLLRSAADVPRGRANDFDLAVRSVESMERRDQRFTSNLHEFHATQDGALEVQKRLAFERARELDDTKDPDFETLKLPALDKVLALQKEFSPEAPLRISELAKIASFWQNHEGDHGYEGTRQEQQQLWGFLKLPVEQRYQALGHAGDYLRDTTGSSLRDLVKAAGGSPEAQERARFVGSVVGTVLTTAAVAAARSQVPASIVTAKAVTGDILHEIRDLQIQNDQAAVQKFFKKKLMAPSSKLDYLQKAYWYGQQNRLTPERRPVVG